MYNAFSTTITSQTYENVIGVVNVVTSLNVIIHHCSHRTNQFLILSFVRCMRKISNSQYPVNNVKRIIH
jgi:hypothetical protein